MMRYASRKFARTFSDMQAACWDAVTEDDEELLITLGVAEGDEFHSTNLNIGGFLDEDNDFSVAIWDRQIEDAMRGMSPWFMGIGLPMEGRNPQSKDPANFIAVAGIEAMNMRLEALVLTGTGERLKPSKWEPLRATEPLTLLMVALRRQVAHQG
jgi:hypothetical protein